MEKKTKQDIMKLFQARWVLSSLTAALDYHLSYKCTVRRYGTLLYRSNLDIRPALTQALWKLRNSANLGACVTNDQGSSMISTTKDILQELNVRVHSQIKYWLQKDAHSPIDHSETNIQKLIQEMDPQLWEAISLLTQSTSERRGTSKVLDSTTLSHNIKNIRRLFLLCSLMFITDDRCSVPLHVLMTDIIENQGGSSLLIRTLNRVGVCASADTLSRFMQFKVNHFGSTVQQYTDSEILAVVSADNVDFLHTYSRVANGNKNSSWHGTTVQVAQPLPSFSLQPQPYTLISPLQTTENSITPPTCQPSKKSDVLTNKSPQVRAHTGHLDSSNSVVHTDSDLSFLNYPSQLTSGIPAYCHIRARYGW